MSAAGSRNATNRTREGQYAYFGCTFWLPPGVPGGGITLSRPPPGGVTSIPLSNPVGGQITPLDCASLSLNGPELGPPPTVGGFPLTSGGHATLGSGATRPWGADCASAELAIVTPPIIEMSKSLMGNAPRESAEFSITHYVQVLLQDNPGYAREPISITPPAPIRSRRPITPFTSAQCSQQKKVLSFSSP